MTGLQSAKKIGLTLEQCHSMVEPIACDASPQSIKNLIGKIFGGRDALMIIWQIHKITWCKIIGGRLVSTEALNPINWLELRAFNRDEEIHLKRAGDIFKGRHVLDELGDGTYFADSFSRLWGEAVDSTDGFVRLLDSRRKLEMTIPIEPRGVKWYGLLTRNYIASDPSTGLSGYADYRFVAIEPAEEGADIG